MTPPNTERRSIPSDRLAIIEKKIDKLTERDEIHDDHHEFIKKVMEREARKENLHRAIIEKTITSLLWSSFVSVGYLIWQGITSHWKW